MWIISWQESHLCFWVNWVYTENREMKDGTQLTFSFLVAEGLQPMTYSHQHLGWFFSPLLNFYGHICLVLIPNQRSLVLKQTKTIKEMVKMKKRVGHRVPTLSWYIYNRTPTSKAQGISRKKDRKAISPRRGPGSLLKDCVFYIGQRRCRNEVAKLWLPK